MKKLKIVFFFLFQIFYSISSQVVIQNKKFINVLNKTHFSCDDKKILKMKQFNDDFCDCEDGSDENSTIK